MGLRTGASRGTVPGAEIQVDRSGGWGQGVPGRWGSGKYAGKTFQPARGFHYGDHHDLWIDPLNPRRMIGGNDGGKEKEEESEEEADRPGGPKKPKLPDKPGLHRVVWDLEHDPARPIKDAKIDSGSAETAPLALPGKYTVRLTVDGQTLTAPLELQLDPRVKVAPADLAEQVRLALAVRDDLNKLSGAVEQLRAIRKQLQNRSVLLKDIEKAKPLVKASSEFVAKLDALEGKLHNPKAQLTYDILAMKGGAQLYSNLGWLYGTVLDGDGPPTQGMREAAARLGAELADRLHEFQALIDTDLAELNRQAKALDLPHIIVPPVKQGP